jgi:4-hydroxy-tetrahydrodipicolinate synthase
MAQEALGRGVIVPMITPFTREGKIDIRSVNKIVDHLILGSTAPFIMGTTGESASIPEKLKPEFVKAMVDTANGRSKTYAGISSPSFQVSIEAARRYHELGVDAVVAHPPSYYPLTDEQLLNYFERLADDLPLPVILYNIPVVTHVSIPVDVLDRLSHHDNIIGIKDSERDMERFNQSIKLWSERDDFVHLVGWGTQMANGLLQGSAGLVPSTGNLVPKMYSDMMKAARNGDHQKLDELQKLTDSIGEMYQKGRALNKSLPALKVMMNALNLCEPYVLTPLENCNEDEKQQILSAMNSFNFQEQTQTA